MTHLNSGSMAPSPFIHFIVRASSAPSRSGPRVGRSTSCELVGCRVGARQSQRHYSPSVARSACGTCGAPANQPDTKDSAVANATHRVSTSISYADFPKLRAFVEWGIDMQLADVRDMLRLPLPDMGLDAGHNFAAA